MIAYDIGQLDGDAGLTFFEYVSIYKAGKAFIKGTKTAAVALREFLSSKMPPPAFAGINGTAFSIVIPSAEAAAQAGAVVGTVPVVLTMVGDFLFNYSSFKNDWNRLQEDMKQPKEAGGEAKKKGEFDVSGNNYLDQLNDFPDERVDHIINGSKGKDHGWDKLVPDKNWDEIKTIIAQVMEAGVEGTYKSVYSKIAIINGYEVEVVYTILEDGSILISNAWVILP